MIIQQLLCGGEPFFGTKPIAQVLRRAGLKMMRGKKNLPCTSVPSPFPTKSRTRNKQETSPRVWQGSKQIGALSGTLYESPKYPPAFDFASVDSCLLGVLDYSSKMSRSTKRSAQFEAAVFTGRAIVATDVQTSTPGPVEN